MTSEAELEALTSPGLLRRARKALAKSSPKLTVEGNNYRFSFEGHQGELTMNRISASRCDCPASSLCKHIISSVLYLQEQVQTNTNEEHAQAATTKPKYVPPVFSDLTLQKIRAKAAWRSAYQAIVEKGYTKTATLSVNEDHCSLRWRQHEAIIGSSDQVNDIVVAGSDSIEKQLLAAVLYETCQQREIPWPKWLIEEHQAVKSERLAIDIELKSDIKTQLLALVALGVSNLAPENLVVLGALISPCRAMGYKEIASLISSVVEQVQRQTERLGQDNNQSILYGLARLYALCDRNMPEQNWQNSRIESLQLMGLGAYQWQTDSGVIGLTLLLLSEQGKVYHATESRAANTGHISIQKLWQSHQFWEGSPLCSRLMGQRFQLQHIERNRWGSISQKRDTVYQANTSVQWPVNAITNWQQLKETEEYGYAVLKPTRWLACEFDEIAQELKLWLEDEKQQQLLVRQAYSPAVSQRISWLSDCWMRQPEYLVVHHRLVQSQHLFEPLCIYEDTWVSLDFEGVEPKMLSVLQRLAAKFEPKRSILKTEYNGLQVLLLRLRNLLLDYPFHRLEDEALLQSELDRYGLTVLAQQLAQLNRQTEAFFKLAYLSERTFYEIAPWPISR